MIQVSSAFATHPGLRRPDNEDALCARADLGLYLVADGMGGHAAGEVASQLAVECIERFIVDSAGADANWAWPLPFDSGVSVAGNRLRTAFRLANRRLAAATGADPALRGMATTAAAVLLAPEPAAVAHVGDSRVYRWRDRRLAVLTNDHSWVGEQIRAGHLSESEANRHPWRNVVTRAIGGGVELDVEVADLPLQRGDRLLVCSDGLSAVVPHDRLEELLSAGRSLDETCQAMIDAANDAGGPDNITVLVLQIDVA